MADHHDHDHDHADHDHDDHDDHKGHAHGLPDTLGRAFALGMALNIAFVVIGVIAGVFAKSTALLADAAHNLGDALGLAMAWGASVLAKRVRTSRRTYGLRRSTIISALFNAMLILVAIGGVIWEAIHQLGGEHHVNGGVVAIVAAIGVLINIAAAMLFAKGRTSDINVRGAYLHLMADAAVSAGVVVSGLIVWQTDWWWVDPASSLVVSAIILYGTWSLLRESLDLLLDAVPAHIDAEAVELYLASVPGVEAVHDLHIWSMSTTEIALTVHLTVPWPPSPGLVHDVATEIEKRFKIAHATIQIEAGATSPCRQGTEAI